MPRIRGEHRLLSHRGGEDGLNQYLTQVRKFPFLAPETEYQLATRYCKDGDTEAAALLVTSHLRLVAKIAMKYRGYGLPVSDLISEGNIGLMRGVQKFDPERGYRLATYAAWWIKASIHEFVLRSWSVVKIGTTATQKKLFFNLRRMKQKLELYSENEMHPDNAAKIATDLGVPPHDVIDMNRRMMFGGDASLNVPVGDESGAGEWVDVLSDDRPLQDEVMEVGQESFLHHDLLVDAMGHLTERERDILTQRRLSDNPPNLEDLSKIYGVSRERIRQIEARAFQKVQDSVKGAALANITSFL